MGIFETLEINDELRELIHSGACSSEIFHAARLAGMESVIEDGYRKIRSGESTCEELLRVLGPVNEMICPHCERPIRSGFLRCPLCGGSIRRKCTACGRALEKEWLSCPFCG